MLARASNDEATVAAGVAAWARLRRSPSTTFSDWIAVAKALHVGRAHCLRVAQTQTSRLAADTIAK
jgi:hypothetical protein